MWKPQRFDNAEANPNKHDVRVHHRYKTYIRIPRIMVRLMSLPRHNGWTINSTDTSLWLLGPVIWLLAIKNKPRKRVPTCVRAGWMRHNNTGEGAGSVVSLLSRRYWYLYLKHARGSNLSTGFFSPFFFKGCAPGTTPDQLHCMMQYHHGVIAGSCYHWGHLNATSICSYHGVM